MILVLEIFNTLPIRMLCIGIDVDNDAIAINGLTEILDIGTGSATENKHDGDLIAGGLVAHFLRHILLARSWILGSKRTFFNSSTPQPRRT